MAPPLRKRSVVIAGHKTSVSLEDVFWEILHDIARARGLSLNRLVADIDRDRDGNLSSTIRVYVVDWLRDRAGEKGQQAAEKPLRTVSDPSRRSPSGYSSG